MHLVITIDTEEDNWGNYSPKGYTLENIERIPALQDLFDEFNVKPAYLITYPVATDDRSLTLLKGIMDRGGCEIGSHCHPWNTPPFEEETGERNSMLCNLPEDLQYRKLQTLHATIIRNFNIEPISFRAGRWGYDKSVANNIHKLGYRIDTSITAHTDWTSGYGPDFSEIPPRPFRFSIGDTQGYMIEIPATVDYLKQNFGFSNHIYKLLASNPLNKMRVVSILNKLNLLNKVWLSPENSDSKSMIALAKSMKRNNCNLINMFFHSATLKAGLTPFVKTRDDERQFLQCIREFLLFARDEGIKSIKLCEAGEGI
ncbi:MAG TPA: polysaccharide deacetylase family protein [Thermodesulfovibrionales bacterium]|nr:polysaccharide deacetylase family protein [Thermodesulfovibrionales bacterium]